MPVTSANLAPTAAPPTPDRLLGASAAVTVQDVSKTFRLPHQQYHTLKERALHPFRSRTYDELRAVQNVSFDVREGEFFGIVGRNGSGKSTLLKCLAGIYGIDHGRLAVAGRLSPFIEIGVGFNPDLTARDNVVINAVMLGLSRKQANARFDDIIAFAELEDFVDLKLKNYSSGMAVRLGFSVAVEVDADVLLIDEVLAVGDASFQRKCLDQFLRLKAEGKTILFVTHDMASVERFCDRAMLLEHGVMVDLGDPETVARKYIELNFGQTVHEAPAESAAAAPARRAVEITGAWFEDGEGQRVDAIAQGAPLAACFEVAFRAETPDPVFGLTIHNEVRHAVFARTSQREGPTGTFAAGTTTTVRVPFENWLSPSTYTLTPSVADAQGLETLALRDNLASVLVHSPQFSGGVVDLPSEMRIGDA